jgi:hypothetical protein
MKRHMRGVSAAAAAAAVSFEAVTDAKKRKKTETGENEQEEDAGMGMGDSDGDSRDGRLWPEAGLRGGWRWAVGGAATSSLLGVAAMVLHDCGVAAGLVVTAGPADQVFDRALVAGGGWGPPLDDADDEERMDARMRAWGGRHGAPLQRKPKNGNKQQNQNQKGQKKQKAKGKGTRGR